MVGREQFAMPFQQKQLDLRIEHLKKPKLEAQWTETILATPVRPGGEFPHSLVPKSKLKFAEKMSQSMTMLPTNLGTFPTVSRPPAMSQSTAAGFCLGIRDAGSEAMAQSQMIDNLMEQSQMTKSSRPDGYRHSSMTRFSSFPCRVSWPLYEDSQAIRAVAFHPTGRYFAIGTNSKQLHISKYPDLRRHSDPVRQPEILLSRPKQHRGYWVLLALGTRRASYLSSRLFVKNSDNRVGGLPAVRLTSRGIQSLTALVHRLPFIRITCLAHLIFDCLAYRTASLIFDC
uniref:WD_REPEATS_REGION domain-containing protein n=1 Tax=Angiostrongylus cantonensis TaxID=6313 RepID=A0A0K0DPF6_ANGCA